MGTPKWGSEGLCDVEQRFGPAPRVRELVADFGLYKATNSKNGFQYSEWFRSHSAIRNFSLHLFSYLDPRYVHLHTIVISVFPDAVRKLLDELEANRQSRKSAWATLQRLRKFLEATGARISIPEDRSFETEGEAIESGLKRTIAGRDAVMRSLIGAIYRFRDATLVAEKKDDG
jgi:hypothetical protein